MLGWLLTVASCTWGQQAQLSGFVRDPSGAVIPKATISVQNLATGSEQSTTTNDSGIYAFTLLPPATYRLVVEAHGFSEKDRRQSHSGSDRQSEPQRGTSD